MSATRQTEHSDRSPIDVIADAVAPHLDTEEKRALARDRAARSADPLEDVRRTRALAELLDLYEERRVLRAADSGQTQRAIAEAAGKPQTQIHRILRRARLAEPNVRAKAREVILLRRAGAITQGMMLGLLQGAAEGASALGEHDSGYAPDDWDEIRSAYMSSLLTEAEYESLRASNAQNESRRQQ